MEKLVIDKHGQNLGSHDPRMTIEMQRN